MRLTPLVSGLLLALAPACGGGHGGHDDHGGLPAAAPMIAPEPWSGALATAAFIDDDPDPAVVEVTLRAGVATVEYLPGSPVEVWAYNGTIPGPTLEAKVGDRVIVHFENDLPEPTTIHWHGLRVASAMDGTTAVAQPIAPGASFDYVLDLLDAGTFWYHPHVRSDVQVEKGLYGAIVVRDAAEPALPAAAEEVVVLDDVMVDPDTGALEEGVDARAAMMGREGNLVLVNGARSNLGVAAQAGERRRWRIVNSANSRYFLLSLAGGELIRVGGDGGLIEAPRAVTELLLVPGERADVLVSVPTPGATATLRALPYERAMGAGATEAVDVVRLVAGDAPAVAPGELPASLRTVAAPATPGQTRTIRLGERMEGDTMQFTINDAAYPDVPALTAALGTTERWEIVNDTEMAHPFHLHGFFFQREGTREWDDTIDIPSRATVPLLVDFAAHDGAAGSWMYHCHILEHAEGGMAGEVRVE